MEEKNIEEKTKVSNGYKIWSIIYIALMIVGIGIIAYLIFVNIVRGEGGIFIVTEPEDAKIYLDAKEVGSSPLFLPKIKAKEYQLKIEKKDYKTYQKTIKIRPNQIIELPLIKLVRIKIKKEKMLQVELPVLTKVEPAPVNVKKEKKEKIKEKIKEKEKISQVVALPTKVREKPSAITAITPPVKLAPTPTPTEVKPRPEPTYEAQLELPKPLPPPTEVATTTLQVSSSPSDAAVYLDGKLIGKTPLSIPIQAGKYKLLISKENYEPYSTKIEVKEGELTFINKKLQILPAKLFIISSPSFAQVCINGRAVGNTPLTIKNLPPNEELLIKIKKLGYKEYEQRVILKPDEFLPIAVTLTEEEKMAYIYITSIPEKATIYIENKKIGITPIREFPILPGRYTIYAHLGKITKKKDITIEEKERQFINFDFSF